jgi:hypothetical protein
MKVVVCFASGMEKSASLVAEFIESKIRGAKVLLVGFGRIFASEIDTPDLFVNMV